MLIRMKDVKFTVLADILSVFPMTYAYKIG